MYRVWYLILAGERWETESRAPQLLALVRDWLLQMFYYSYYDTDMISLLKMGGEWWDREDEVMFGTQRVEFRFSRWGAEVRKLFIESLTVTMFNHK